MEGPIPDELGLPNRMLTTQEVWSFEGEEGIEMVTSPRKNGSGWWEQSVYQFNLVAEGLVWQYRYDGVDEDGWWLADKSEAD